MLHHTFLGKALRATIQEREAARLAGIHVDRMKGVAFAIGGMLIGLAGPSSGAWPIFTGRGAGSDPHRHCHHDLCRRGPHSEPSLGSLYSGGFGIGGRAGAGDELAGIGERPDPYRIAAVETSRIAGGEKVGPGTVKRHPISSSAVFWAVILVLAAWPLGTAIPNWSAVFSPWPFCTPSWPWLGISRR